MRYHAPFGSSDPNAPYVDRDTPGAVRGSVPPAAAIEHPQREMDAFITRNGLTPSQTDLTQLSQAAQIGLTNYAVAGGTANALTLTLDPAPAAYVTGMRLWVKTTLRNTGACTLNVNGLGVKSIVRGDGTALLYSDLLPGRISELVFDGTAFQLVGLPNATKMFYQGVAASGGTLTVDQIGSVVQVGVGTGVTNVALPAASNCPNGGRINVFHNGNFDCNLVRQGSDQIGFADGTLLTSITLKVGDTLELLCLGTSTTWLVIGGTVANRAGSDFKRSGGGSGNGIQRLPGGTVIQRFMASTTSSTGATFVAFPTFFASSDYVVTALDTGGSAYVFGAGNNGAGSFTLYAKNSSGSYVSGAQCQVLAVGV